MTTTNRTLNLIEIEHTVYAVLKEVVDERTIERKYGSDFTFVVPQNDDLRVRVTVSAEKITRCSVCKEENTYGQYNAGTGYDYTHEACKPFNTEETEDDS